MKNKIVIFILVFSIILGSYSFADEDSSILDENLTLQMMEYDILKMKIDLENTEDIVENLQDTLRKFSFLKSIGRPVRKSTKFNVIYNKETVIPFSEYGYNTNVDMMKLTNNNLSVSLNQLYIAYYSATKSLESVELQLENESYKLEQMKEKYEKGLISRIELDEAVYNYEVIVNDRLNAQNNYNAVIRQINGLVGNADIDQEINHVWNFELQEMKSLDEYTELAIENRFEIIDIDRQIELKELEIDIYTSLNGSYLSDITVKADYLKVENKLKQLLIDREMIIKNLETEMAKSYNDTKIAYNNYLKTNNMYENQIELSEIIEKQYALGYITKSALIDFSIGLEQLEMAVNLSLLNYNSLVEKLDYSSGLGFAINFRG